MLAHAMSRDALPLVHAGMTQSRNGGTTLTNGTEKPNIAHLTLDLITHCLLSSTGGIGWRKQPQNTNQQTKRTTRTMKTLAKNHPIRTTLARYIFLNTAAAWEQFAAACTTRGVNPEVIIQRYCH